MPLKRNAVPFTPEHSCRLKRKRHAVQAEFPVSGISLLEEPFFAPFHTVPDWAPDGLISASWVPALSLPEEKPVYVSETGLFVYLENGTEHRYLRDFFTGQVRTHLIDAAGEKSLLAVGEPSQPFRELELLNSLGLEKTMSEHGRWILHASFIETDQGAILFTAPSQTGKSTQAALWEKHHGVRVINGDRAGGGVPWSGTSGISLNRSMPLRAIVLLSQGPQNMTYTIPFPAKVARLLEQTTINPWNREMLLAAQLFWMELCKEIPVIGLSCLPDEGAVDSLEKELKKYGK